MKNILLAYATLLFTCVTLAQTTFTSTQYKFSMLEPANWIPADRETLDKNAHKLDLSEKEIDDMLQKQKKAVSLMSYFKYNIKGHPGLIPAINVDVRNNPAKDFASLKKGLEGSLSVLQKTFPDAEYIHKPSETVVGGQKCIYFSIRYTVHMNDGQMVLKTKCRSYIIPYRNYLFRMNLIDGQTEEDCTTEFDDLIKSIKIG